MSFTSLGLCAKILQAIKDQGYENPTPIQAHAIPVILCGKDLLAGAQTGTGKTAGFTLPILHMLADKSVKRPASGRPLIRALVLVPTRELALQVEESVSLYGKYLPLTSLSMIGGVNINPQIKSLKSRVDILVATPGRLLDHVRQKTVDLTGVKILVLDEADRMLDMGFIQDIKKILNLLPQKRQNLLFSATFSDDIKSLAERLLDNPIIVEVAPRNTTAEMVNHKAYPVDSGKKRALLSELIKNNNWQQVLVFTRTKHGANKLAEYLTERSINSLAIHGNKSQTTRIRALSEFKNGTLQVLVATDIAARGIDISNLPHVVNFELPNVAEDYVHRIGRTGRAGKAGDAVSLVSPDEYKFLLAIERVIKKKIPQEIIPGFEPNPHAMKVAMANKETKHKPKIGGFGKRGQNGNGSFVAQDRFRGKDKPKSFSSNNANKRSSGSRGR